MKRALSVILIVFGGVACSIFHSKVHPYPTGVVFPLVQAENLHIDGRVIRSLVRVAGRVYFSTDKGFVYCLDGATRKLVWTYKAEAGLGCPPAVGERSAAVWDSDNVVHGITLDGNPLWKAQLAEPIASEICAAKDRFYLGTRAGWLYALNAATGEVVWSFETSGAVEAGCVTWLDEIILGTTDGKLYFLSLQGKLLKKLEAGSAIRVTPLVDRSRLYYGTEDGRYNCLDIPSYSRKWRMRTDGRVLSPAIADSKRVYFAASNTVLYALDKSDGDIDWWAILPSRSEFRPELAGEKILATCSSPVILCLNRKRGEQAGRYESGQEIRSNPVWAAPEIFVAEYDSATAKGGLTDLRKAVKVDLGVAPGPPGAVGTEVTLTAAAAGFFEPKYEFFTRLDGQTVVLQKESLKNSCSWFPDKIAEFSLGVRVKDARENKETEITYKVAK